MENARKWSGYVCPDCRFVFRVPKDHDGKGVVCPGCRRMLRIPVPGERLPPLVVSIQNPGAEADPSMKSDKERRRKRKSRSGRSHEWDNESDAPDGSGRGDGRQMFWMMIAGSTLFLLIVVWVVAAMFGGTTPDSQVSVPEQVAMPMANPVEPLSSAVVQKSNATVLAEAEPMVRRFLEASRIEDLLPVVRHPEVTEVRMRGHYKDAEIVAPGMAAFNTTSQLSRLGTVVSVRVRTRNYEDRSIALVETPEGLRIDWESWVGWSEMPWAEFLDSKPTSAKLFRVNLSSVDYYNFSFSDEEKWRSYRLESPDGEHAVFGYVERGTVLDSLLRPPPDVKQVALTLALRCPENATSGNQVVIDRSIAEGWVLENEETQ